MAHYNVVKSLRSYYEPDVPYRMDCPFCGGKNTLGVIKRRGSLIWNCFKAGCSCQGRHQGEMSVQDLRTVATPALKREDSVFIPLERWRSPLWDEEAIKYLTNYHCLNAFQTKLADIRYDPVERRVVFVKYDLRGQIIGATGRTLIRDLKPKWYRYDKADYPYVCNREMPDAVIVEDSASAVAVSELATGVALLGTRLSMTVCNELRNKRSIIVALDPDAQRKGLEFRQKLAYLFDNVRCATIPDDLKYYDTTSLRKILKLQESENIDEEL